MSTLYGSIHLLFLHYIAGFRRLLCELTLNVIPPRSESLLDELLKSDTSLWKGNFFYTFLFLSTNTFPCSMQFGIHISKIERQESLPSFAAILINGQIQ